MYLSNIYTCVGFYTHTYIYIYKRIYRTYDNMVCMVLTKKHEASETVCFGKHAFGFPVSIACLPWTSSLVPFLSPMQNQHFFRNKLFIRLRSKHWIGESTITDNCFKIADLDFSRTTAFTPAKHSRVVVFTTARPWLMSHGWSQIGRWYEIVFYVF